jgi:hypothetical protein
VYRISDLTREEAEEVIEDQEGYACSSLYRRQDGTVLVQDCPKGIAAARKASRWWKERMFHLFLLVLPWMILTGYIYLDTAHDPYGYHGNGIWDIEPFRTLDQVCFSGPAPVGGVATPATAIPMGPGGPGGFWIGDGPPIDPEMFPPDGAIHSRRDQDPPP